MPLKGIKNLKMLKTHSVKNFLNFRYPSDFHRGIAVKVFSGLPFIRDKSLWLKMLCAAKDLHPDVFQQQPTIKIDHFLFTC